MDIARIEEVVKIIESGKVTEEQLIAFKKEFSDELSKASFRTAQSLENFKRSLKENEELDHAKELLSILEDETLEDSEKISKINALNINYDDTMKEDVDSIKQAIADIKKMKEEEAEGEV